MTVPMDYRYGTERFLAFLAQAARRADLVTRNQSYTMVQGVLLAFRRRLTIAEAIDFAQVLPPMLRALFAPAWGGARFLVARALIGGRVGDRLGRAAGKAIDSAPRGDRTAWFRR